MRIESVTIEAQNPTRPATSDAAGAGGFLRQVWASVCSTIVLTAICCGAYPLLVWGVAQLAFPVRANGSLVTRDGTPTTDESKAAGSALLGQAFADARYFHPRPSSAGGGYDAANSSGSNLGPLSKKLLCGTTKKDDKGKDVVDFDGVALRTLLYCDENGLDVDVVAGRPLATFKDGSGNYDQVRLIAAFNAEQSPLKIRARTPVPADAVTASGSGLDPHISPANAAIQVARVAKARGVPAADVQRLVDEYTDRPDLGVFGDPGVNVLRLNLALDKATPVAAGTAATAPSR
ncbi:MAG TPA: potassium-transporting ATPase subunit C [Humisphaera sp.]